MIQFEHVSDGTGCIADFSLEISPKENVCLIGKQASGKSMLVRMLTLQQHPKKGRIVIDNADLRFLPSSVIPLLRKNIGYIAQTPYLLPNLTLQENVALPLEIRGADQKTIARRVRDILAYAHLTKFADLLPSFLPQSSAALACICRAMVSSPMIIIADEPFAHLSPEDQRIALGMLKLTHEHGTTLITLTRDAQIASALEARAVSLGEEIPEKNPPESTPPKVQRVVKKAKSIQETPQGFTPKTNRKPDTHRVRVVGIGSGLE